MSAIGDGDFGGALAHGVSAIPVGPGKLGKAGKLALSSSDEAATPARALDQASEFAQARRAGSHAGKEQIRSKKHAGMEATRLIFEQLQEWGG